MLQVSAGRARSEAALHLSGELDLSSAGFLRTRITMALESAPTVLVLDLSDLDFIDSTGIGVVVGAFKRAKGVGCEVRLRSPRAGVRKALEFVGLDRIFVIQD